MKTPVVGGKAKNLIWLKSQGIRVPDFFVLAIDSHHEFIKTGKISDISDRELNEFLNKHPDSLFAVRSSVTGEDGDNHSFAGLFETFLNCKPNEVKTKIIEAYNSTNSPRVQEYTRTKNIEIDLSMAVVIQVMSNSVKSGVAFSRSPVRPSSLVVIDAGMGLGEGVVSGHVEVQTIKATRLLEVISNEGPKVLNDDEINSITKICLKLEDLYQTPCDIEWSITDKNELNILQIRPITQDFDALKVLADTNLSESYPGSVSPFTGAFVKRSYENVFIESAIALGANQERLKELTPHYAKLIAEVDNHLYYDLEHYYAILRALPGGDKNIDNWHQMIGGEFKNTTIRKHGSSLSVIETIYALVSILKFFILHNRIFSNLIQSFTAKKEEETQKIHQLNSSKELLSYLSQMIETRFDFGLTVVNDALIMIGLGLLKKRLVGISENDLADLLQTHEEVTSVKPLFALEKLATKISSSTLNRLLEYSPSDWVHPYESFFKKELSLGEESSVQAIKEFLHDFGDRSFEELKLESLTFKQDPQLLARTLQWSLKNKVSNAQKDKSISKNIKLSFLTKIILKKTRAAIEMRETTRMWRGKFYNLIREAIIKAAQQLRAENIAFSNLELKDFFSLTHTEWSKFANQELSQENALKIIQARKNWKFENRKFPEFLIWSLSESLPTIDHKIDKTDLKGTGVSLGIVQGKCLVIEKPEEAFNIEDISSYILVTKNTDPAWVFIMSKSKGLVSEKGSLLSHTAIIGRELKIPTIVGVSGITQRLKTNDLIEMNPETGTIKIL